MRLYSTAETSSTAIVNGRMYLAANRRACSTIFALADVVTVEFEASTVQEVINDS